MTPIKICFLFWVFLLWLSGCAVCSIVDSLPRSQRKSQVSSHSAQRAYNYLIYVTFFSIYPMALPRRYLQGGFSSILHNQAICLPICQDVHQLASQLGQRVVIFLPIYLPTTAVGFYFCFISTLLISPRLSTLFQSMHRHQAWTYCLLPPVFPAPIP